MCLYKCAKKIFWAWDLFCKIKYCNNQVKYLSTNFNMICPYFDKLSKENIFFLFLNGNKIFKKFQKKFNR